MIIVRHVSLADMFIRLHKIVQRAQSMSRCVFVCEPLRLHSTNESISKGPKKSIEKERTPMGKLDENAHPDVEKQPLQPWPNRINPITGEINGPSGPEPTRYGDWERKGKCVDF
jgi:hypothetical protein